jgi:hypothetical protein
VLVYLFSRLENVFKRFEKYAEARLPETMREFMIKMMVEVLGVLAIATKSIKQRWISESIPMYKSRLADHPQRNM